MKGHVIKGKKSGANGRRRKAFRVYTDGFSAWQLTRGTRHVVTTRHEQNGPRDDLREKN